MNDDIKDCSKNYIHQDKVNNAQNSMPSDKNITSVTELFKVLGDETRTKILSVLVKEELCVCDIAKILNMTKSAISHQLKVLKLAKLIKSKKIGKEVFYALDDDHVLKMYTMAIEHVME